MEISQSNIYEEILEIANSGNPPVHFRYYMDLLANGKLHRIDIVLSLERIRDYENNYCDETLIEVEIAMGTFIHEIYPYRNHLLATLYRERVGSLDRESIEGVRPDIQQFQAVLVETDSLMLTDGSLVTSNKEQGDKAATLKRTFQLIDKSLGDLRMASVTGIYRDARVGDILKTVMKGDVQNAASGVSTPVSSDRVNEGGFTTVIGIDMVSPNNTRQYHAIIVPPHIKLLDLPLYLQEEYGVYSSGVGYYLQRGIMYIYPLCDLLRFTSTTRGLRIANLPPTRMAGADKTFKVKDKQVFVMATGEVVQGDPTDFNQLNLGNGIRYLQADKIIDRFSTTSKNRTNVYRSNNLVEYISHQRPDGRNNIVYSPRQITINHQRESSALATRLASTIDIVWENSDPTLIYPGMPVRFYYHRGEILEWLEGVVIKAHHYSSASTPGLVNDKHITRSTLTLLVNRDT
ncbi:hypothetical protein [Endozoicomonas sp. ONNA1]|uniref:hypothetical protein n=1 Tax=Endozoicomonas sp. ONNA1 TaxID=2828740 RepID=UPI002148B249|nr:hypothetical protein [Endozoicomonas sp. ONNA1]